MTASVLTFPDRERTDLTGAPHMLDVAYIDHLARQAMQNGWAVTRRCPTHFVAGRTRGGVTEQVSAAVINGALRSSHMRVVAETNVSDQVVAWLESGEQSCPFDHYCTFTSDDPHALQMHVENVHGGENLP